MSAETHELSLEDLENLVAEDPLPGAVAPEPAASEADDGGEGGAGGAHAAKAAVYDAKIAKYREAAASPDGGKPAAKRVNWKRASVLKTVAPVAAQSSAAKKPHSTYSGRFGDYDTKGGGEQRPRAGLLRGIKAKLALTSGAKADQPEPDPWHGFVMPETMSSEEEEEAEERAARSGDELWRILRAKWKMFQASKGWLTSTRTLHGTSDTNIELVTNSMEDMAAAKRLASQRCCFFVPDEPFRMRWDVLQVVMIAYVGTLIPYREAFDITVPAFSPAFWFDVLVVRPPLFSRRSSSPRLYGLSAGRVCLRCRISTSSRTSS